MCKVVDTRGDVVRKNDRTIFTFIGLFARSKPIPDIDEGSDNICQNK